MEEMFVTEIPEGAIYYGKTRHRMTVALTEDLRRQTKDALAEMHRLFAQRYTPKAKWTRDCKNCSLVEICLPKLEKRMTASEYVKHMLAEE